MSLKILTVGQQLLIWASPLVNIYCSPKYIVKPEALYKHVLFNAISSDDTAHYRIYITSQIKATFWKVMKT